MLGFAYVNPQVAIVHQSYKRYSCELISNDSPSELEQIEKFFKRSAKDTRQKVLWVVGTETLRRIKQDYPAEKMAGVLIGVFDAAEKLSKDPDIKIVDAELQPHTVDDKAHAVWKMHSIDFHKVMAGHPLGYVMPPPAPVVEAPKMVTPDAPVKLSPPKRQAADSLPALFDGMLASITSEKKRAKASSWIACRLEGAFNKEEWTQALSKIAEYGVDAELIKGAIRVFKTAGHLDKTRAAVQAMVLEGLDVPAAVKKTAARPADLAWLETHWPLSNLTAESFGA